MKLGRLTQLGMDRFSAFLDELKFNPSAKVPKDLLSFPAYFTTTDDEIEVVPYRFNSRWDVGKYMNSLISSSGIDDPERDTLLWAGLTVFYFDVLCPVSKTGQRKVRERAAYIPESQNWRRYYRHLLLGPYLIYRAHLENPERAMALLCKPPHVIGEVEAQIAAYQELISNKAVVELATRLYYDSQTKTTKPGAGDKESPIAPRRLVSILRQFDLTWDLYAASTEEILVPAVNFCE